jgi:hypothetical protein
VDFVYKQVADGDKKWALRNAKPAREALVQERDVSLMTAYLEEQLAVTPLELIAKLCVHLNIDKGVVRNIFESYDGFLRILDDPAKRGELATARSHEDLRASKAWAEVRAVSMPFHDGLVALFLREDTPLRDLTMRYGLF